MTTIQIQVQDDVVQRLGVERVKQLIRHKIDAEEFRLAAEHIKQAMDEVIDVDWEIEFEQVRQQTWDEYKQKRGLV